MSEDRRPLILLDVDGVINVSASSAVRKSKCFHDGWRQPMIPVNGYEYRVFYNPQIGQMVRLLAAETGAELAWATMWEDDANSCIGPLLGLPRLRVGPALAYGSKARGIVPWTEGRPFVWFDDDEAEIEAMSEYAGSQPHLPVHVDEFTGLTESHAAAARAWLSGLH